MKNEKIGGSTEKQLDIKKENCEKVTFVFSSFYLFHLKELKNYYAE